MLSITRKEKQEIYRPSNGYPNPQLSLSFSLHCVLFFLFSFRLRNQTGSVSFLLSHYHHFRLSEEINFLIRMRRDGRRFVRGSQKLLLAKNSILMENFSSIREKTKQKKIIFFAQFKSLKNHFIDLLFSFLEYSLSNFLICFFFLFFSFSCRYIGRTNTHFVKFSIHFHFCLPLMPATIH